MKITVMIFATMLLAGIMLWMLNIILALTEMDKQEDQMWENFKLEEEQESCQNGGNPAKRI